MQEEPGGSGWRGGCPESASPGERAQLEAVSRTHTRVLGLYRVPRGNRGGRRPHRQHTSARARLYLYPSAMYVRQARTLPHVLPALTGQRLLKAHFWRFKGLLRNLYAGQKATVRTGHGTIDWFQIGKGVRQGCILSPCLFNLDAEYIMQIAGMDEAQAGIKIAGRNINNLRYADDTTFVAES